MSALNQIVHVVQVVETVQKAKPRVPPEIEGRRTFFSRFDLWMYQAVLDNRLCNACLRYEATPRYFGVDLRTVFPHLEIMDENTIYAKVHLNCRCFLIRVVDWTLDDIKWFVEYAGERRT